MAKEKVTTIFGKNHISIVKYENTENLVVPGYCNSSGQEIDNYVTREEGYKSSLDRCVSTRFIKKQSEKSKLVEVRVKSPLGFYYTKKVWEDNNSGSEYDLKTGKLIIWKFIKGTTRYEVSYYRRFGNTSVSVETRPWELVPGDKAWEDHYTNDLLEELGKIFEFTENKKLSGIKFNFPNRHYSSQDDYYTGRLKELKRIIFTDLFGYPDGPKYQTNEEKILAAGFDLKTSFRK